MKKALILAIATMGWSIAAFAQASDVGTSPGPHDPNPPMNTPDLRLPPPCAPMPNLATASAGATPGTVQPAPPAPAAVVMTASGDTQCSANTLPQSAAMPSDSPLVP